MTWKDLEMDLLENIDTILDRNSFDSAKDLLHLVTAAAIAHDKAKDEQPSADVVPLYEYFDAKSGRRWYGVGDQVPETSATRSAVPLCRVWRNPSSLLALDPAAQPLPF